MTDLQASLIVIGIAIVAGVVLYNKWQEFKEKKTVERAFAVIPDDVLMGPQETSRLQKVLSPESARHEPVFQAQPVEMQFEQENDREAAVIAVPSASPPVALPIDDLIDCPVPLALETPLYGEKILPVVQTFRHIGNKAVHFIGMRADGEWEAVTHGSIYIELQAGVQLANRHGALNELEYSELVIRLRQIADELGAEPDVPDMSQVMAAARELHQFVMEYDAKLSVNILSQGNPWVINTLLAALERQGFDLRPDGRLVMSDGENGVLFTLSTNVTLAAQHTSRLTLLLDVPCVAPARDGFGAMLACASTLAGRLGGLMVDDTDQPLSDAALAEIASQLDAFYNNMETAGIPAGSTRALRLFS